MDDATEGGHRPFVALGRRAFSQRDYRASERYFTMAIAAAPSEADPYVRRGWARCARARALNNRQEFLAALEPVLADYRRALELAPNDPRVIVSVIEGEILAGRADAAADRAAAALDSVDGHAWRGIVGWLGVVACELAGRPQDAQAGFRSALRPASAAFTEANWNPDDVKKYLAQHAADDVPAPRAAAAWEAHTAITGPAAGLMHWLTQRRDPPEDRVTAPPDA